MWHDSLLFVSIIFQVFRFTSAKALFLEYNEHVPSLDHRRLWFNLDTVNVPAINTYEYETSMHRRHVSAHMWHPMCEMDKELVLLCITLSAYDSSISSICTGSQRWVCTAISPSHQSLQGLGSNGCWLFLILRLVSLQSTEGWLPLCSVRPQLCQPGRLTKGGTCGLATMAVVWRLLGESVLMCLVFLCVFL